MAIESTFRGKGELAQAGPSVELKDAPLGGVFKQAFTTLGTPFGAIIGESKDIALNDFNFLEPSVPIFSGSNLFDAQKNHRLQFS